MKQISSIIVTTLLATLIADAALAATPKAAAGKPAAATQGGKPIAIVNGTPIDASIADILIAEQASKGTQITQELRDAVRKELIARELLAQEARKQGLDKSSDVQARIAMSRQGVLISADLDQYLKEHPITDELVKSEYQRQVALAGPTEYKLRHILLASEANANTIIQKLKAGEKFDALAAQSIDEPTRGVGGDLGWTHPSSFPDQLKQIITNLKKGEYTATPVKSTVGYHVFMLDDTRPTSVPPFDNVKERIRQVLAQDAIKKHSAELQASAKIE
jgi:peptidyl-prolyl cis-trans isomerase C